MPEVAPRRPGLTSLTRGNLDAFPSWGKYNPETTLRGCDTFRREPVSPCLSLFSPVMTRKQANFPQGIRIFDRHHFGFCLSFP